MRDYSCKTAAYATMYEKYAASNFSDLQSMARFRFLQDIVRLALDHNAKIVLFIQPYHADYLELMHEKRLWTSFEDWKRALVRLVEFDRASHPGEIRLFDFSGYNGFTTESVPVRGDLTSQMRWYWEPGHYKSELGDRMIAAMFNGATDFGVELNSGNIESHLAEIALARSHYLGGVSAHASHR